MSGASLAVRLAIVGAAALGAGGWFNRTAGGTPVGSGAGPAVDQSNRLPFQGEVLEADGDGKAATLGSSAAPLTEPLETATAPSARVPQTVDALGPEVGLAGESIESGVIESEVEFTIGNAREGAKARIHVAGARAPEDGVIVIPVDKDGGTIHLPDGEYLAAVFDEGVGSGGVVRFATPREGETVVLEAPFAFDLDFRLVEWRTREPVPLSLITLRRVDLHGDWPAQTIRGVGNADGLTRVEGASPGRWMFEVERDGFEPIAQEIELALEEAEREKARQQGVIEFGDVAIVALRPIGFQLEGADDWADLAGFRIAHTHAGTPVSFDQSGAATLEIGSHGNPLYLKLWYPDERMSVFYLNNGIPGPGEVHRIQVGAAGAVEVDLAIDAELEEELANLNCTLRVAYLTADGNDMFCGRDVEGEGVYEFDGIEGAVAMVNFVTWKEGALPLDWATERVEVVAGESTSVTLTVERAPVAVQIQDADGGPLAGVAYRLYQAPNDTSWVIGGVSDEAGKIRLPRLKSQRALITAQLPGDTEVAFDVPIDLSPANESPVLKFGSGELTFIDTTCEGKPAGGIWFRFHLAESNRDFLSRMSQADGQTEPFVLHPRSQVEVILGETEFWAPAMKVELRPGRNHFPIWKTGFIEVAAGVPLAEVTSSEFGVTLGDWVEQGAVGVIGAADGARRIRVPIGSYRRELPDQDPVAIEVERDLVSHVGR